MITVKRILALYESDPVTYNIPRLVQYFNTALHAMGRRWREVATDPLGFRYTLSELELARQIGRPPVPLMLSGQDDPVFVGNLLQKIHFDRVRALEAVKAPAAKVVPVTQQRSARQSRGRPQKDAGWMHTLGEDFPDYLVDESLDQVD